MQLLKLVNIGSVSKIKIKIFFFVF